MEFTRILELYIESGNFGGKTIHYLLDRKPVRRFCKIHLATLHVVLEFLIEHKNLEDICKNI